MNSNVSQIYDNLFNKIIRVDIGQIEFLYAKKENEEIFTLYITGSKTLSMLSIL